MVDHIRTLLINPTGTAGYLHVSDDAADTAMGLFGVTDSNAATVVDAVLPLAMSDDLSQFRTPFDQRISPSGTVQSVYRHSYSAYSTDDLYDSVLGSDGMWKIQGLFSSDDQVASALLTKMREASHSKDAPYALGAVLLACAYRRLLLQGE